MTTQTFDEFEDKQEQKENEEVTEEVTEEKEKGNVWEEKEKVREEDEEEDVDVSPVIVIASPSTPSLAAMFEEPPEIHVSESVDDPPSTCDESIEFQREEIEPSPDYHELPPDYEESQQHDTIAIPYHVEI